MAPEFSETFSPPLPLGFNYGRHLLWLDARDPALIGKGRGHSLLPAILELEIFRSRSERSLLSRLPFQSVGTIKRRFQQPR